ncbi:hypothetical protein TNCV_3750071 [Trichonephila clavipes]|nr:hypothetical protein TNCV_3750071 [Trichonephila clavipes]
MSTLQRTPNRKRKYKPKPTIKDPKRNFNSFSPTMNQSDKTRYCIGHPGRLSPDMRGQRNHFFPLLPNLPAKISVGPNVNGRYKTLDKMAKRALIVVIARTIIRGVNF